MQVRRSLLKRDMVGRPAAVVDRPRHTVCVTNVRHHVLETLRNVDRLINQELIRIGVGAEFIHNGDYFGVAGGGGGEYGVRPAGNRFHGGAKLGIHQIPPVYACVLNPHLHFHCVANAYPVAPIYTGPFNLERNPALASGDDALIFRCSGIIHSVGIPNVDASVVVSQDLEGIVPPHRPCSMGYAGQRFTGRGAGSQRKLELARAQRPAPF